MAVVLFVVALAVTSCSCGAREPRSTTRPGPRLMRLEAATQTPPPPAASGGGRHGRSPPPAAVARRPQRPDRAGGHVPGAVRLLVPDGVDDRATRRSPDLWPKPFHPTTTSRSSRRRRLVRYAANTLLYAGLSTIGMLSRAFRSPTRWPGSAGGARNVAFLLVLATMMLPPQVTLVPLYVMFSKLHLAGTLGAADPAQLLRRRVLHLPAAPVLPDDPRGVLGRGPGRRRGRVAGDAARRRPASPSRRSRRSRCSASSSAGTTSSGRCSTPARTPATGRCRSASPSSAPSTRSQWNLTMAATLLFMLPVILAVLRRSEGLRRGRHPDGGEGMSA